MNKYLKLINIIVFIPALTVILLVPLRVFAQGVSNAGWNPCWIKSECDAKNGIWGKDATDSGDGLIGCLLDGGTVSDGKCISINANSKDCKETNKQPTAKCYNRVEPIKLQVPIPGLPTTFAGGFPVYMAAFYKFFITALAVMAVVMIMWGGFKRIYAAGASERISDANDTIISAIIGLILALVSYSLLQLVNPRLVDLSKLVVEKIKEQNFGDWCAQDLKDPNGNDMTCDKLYTDENGYSCRGSYCLQEPGEGPIGCWSVGYDKNDTAPDGTKSDPIDYQCKQKYEACNSINSDNIEKIFGDADEKISYHKIWKSACNQYSDTDGTCSYVPSSNSVASGVGKCLYTDKGSILSYCSGMIYNTEKPCNSYFDKYVPGDVNDEPDKQLDWMACYNDWCDLGCKVDSDINKFWTCTSK